MPGGSFDRDLREAVADLLQAAAAYGANAILNMYVMFNSQDSTEYVDMVGRKANWLIRADVVRVSESGTTLESEE